MAAIAERITEQELTWAGLPLPVTVRPAVAMTDDELMSFSRQNRIGRAVAERPHDNRFHENWL